MTEASKPKLWQNAAAVVKQRKEERKNEWKKRKREVTRAGEVEPLETWYLVWKSSLLWCSKWACIFKEKPKQMYASWFRKKRKKKKDRMRDGGRKKNSAEGEWKRDFLFFFTPLLSVSLPYLPKPSNYSNEWLRARQRRRQREAVRDWEDRWGRRGVKEGDSSLLFICYECHSSPDPALIGQWRLTAETRCQDLEGSLLSYRLCESWCLGKRTRGLK